MKTRQLNVSSRDAERIARSKPKHATASCAKCRRKTRDLVHHECPPQAGHRNVTIFDIIAEYQKD